VHAPIDPLPDVGALVVAPIMTHNKSAPVIAYFRDRGSARSDPVLYWTQQTGVRRMQHSLTVTMQFMEAEAYGSLARVLRHF